MFKKMILAIVSIFITFTIVSCGEETKTYKVKFETNGGSKVETQVVEEGKTATKPVNPTYKGFEFIDWYEDQALEKVFNFSQAITKDITVYAKWKKVKVELEIKPLSSSLNSNLVLYNANKSVKDNKKTEFFDLTKKYVVGDDNAWCAKPEVSFVKYNPETGAVTPTKVSEWNYSITIYLLNGETYEKIENSSDYIDSIDYKNATIDFSAKAIGNSFKVEVLADGLKEKDIMTFTFDVIDGYNVYDAKELSYIDNRTSGDEAAAWKAFKVENNLDENYKPTNLILHTNINITANDVPTYFFYTKDELSKSDSDYERALGSMKDVKNFYFRDLKDNEEFNLYGNYFSLSIETLKEVVRERGKITEEGTVISHTTLLRFEGSEKAHVTLQNTNFIGNAPRVENTIKAGGQICMKVQGPSFEAVNNITTCFFIAYMPNVTYAPFLIDKCKAYDSFNSFIYNWGSCDVTLRDSEMIGAGGPVIIQDHVSPTASDGGSVAKTKIENCNLSSYVVGQEGWFTVVNATAIVPLIKTLNQLFTPLGKSFLKDNADHTLSYFNFICINKSGSAETITNEKIKGSLSIDDSEFNFGETNPYIAALIASGAPVFQSSASTLEAGYGYTDGKGMYSVKKEQIINPADLLYQGEYLGLYYNGMMIVFGFGDAGQVYSAEY